MMNERNAEMIELNDIELMNVMGGKGYYGSRFKLLKKKSLVNFFYWLLFDDKSKKKKTVQAMCDDQEYDDQFDDCYDDYYACGDYVSYEK